jgi:hypothetical protein
LIVDDQAGFRASARRLLEAEGVMLVGDRFDVCADVVREHSAAVVLTSSRTITGLQDRLLLNRACGFIPKSDLSGSAIRVLTG